MVAVAQAFVVLLAVPLAASRPVPPPERLLPPERRCRARLPRLTAWSGDTRRLKTDEQTLVSAVDTMRMLFSDLSTAKAVARGLHDDTGAPLRQLHVVAAPSALPQRYIGVAASADGIRIVTSLDLRRFSPVAIWGFGGDVEAPYLQQVSGRAPGTAKEKDWWVLAFENSSVGGRRLCVALFTSSQSLLAGNATRVFVAPNLSIFPANSGTPVVPSSYGSPTIYTAVYSKRDGRTVVDVVLSIAWTDNKNSSHPASALIAALSPDVIEQPDFNTFFYYHGTGYDPGQTTPEEESASSTCTGYLVSGAGTDDVNGCYVQHGEFQQHPLFVLDSGHTLYYYGSPPHANAWRLGLMGHNATYVSASGDPAFPLPVPPESTGGCGIWNTVGPGKVPCPAIKRSNLPPPPPPSPPHHDSVPHSAGPMLWEYNMRKAVTNFSYTGSDMAFVPCGPGCGDPRDLAGGNADGLPGTQKISIVSGIASDGRSVLLLWGWDPINKVAWLWPSGFGTMQGGFNKTMLEVLLPNTTLAQHSLPKISIVPCPPGDFGHCLWVGVMTTQGQMTFFQSLQTQQPVASHFKFAPRFRTAMQPIALQPSSPLPPPPAQQRKTVAVQEAAKLEGLLSLQNDAFKLVVDPNGGNFSLTALTSPEKLTRTFKSSFSVIFSTDDPELTDLKDHGGARTQGTSIYSIADDYPSYWNRKKTATPLQAGDRTIAMLASAAKAINSTAVELIFAPASAEFGLKATLVLRAGSELPRLSWTLQAKTHGYFSAGFMGAPTIALNSTLGFAQAGNCFQATTKPATRGHGNAGDGSCPLDESVVFPDAGANLPYALVPDTDGSNVALVADPSSTLQLQMCEPWPDHPKGFSAKCPTNECPVGSAADACQNRGWASQARCSLGIRAGNLSQPVIFAPVFGGFGSLLTVDDSHSFTVQLLLKTGSPSSAYRQVATDVFGFRDERDNSGPGSLNGALERMSDYLADADGNNFQQFDAINKFDFYWMDQASAFKPLDFMSALSVALTTDDDRLYMLFARETAKFSLSHSDKAHYLWPYLPTVGLASAQAVKHLGMGQNAGGGFATSAEVMQIYRLSGSHSASLVEYAMADAPGCGVEQQQELCDHGFFGGLCDAHSCFDASRPCPDNVAANDAMTFYQSSAPGSAEQKHWWNCTLEIAHSLTMLDAKNLQPSSSFKCNNIDFFLSIYTLTGMDIYKQAAQLCEANCEVGYRMFPRASALDGESITVDKGNRSFSYWWTHGRWGSWGWPLEQRGMWAKEQTVPTWRASHIGLKTAAANGGSWLGTISLDSPVKLLRVASLANDTFARALARASIVGRFGHFPGDFASQPGHTLLWESGDLANRVLPTETQTTWNTGHFWPVAGVTLDFLLSDAADKSHNGILFPSTFVNALPYGRLYSPALGVGAFYGEPAHAWIPSGLFKAVSNAQVNWIAARSNSSVYIALLSQSFVTEAVICVLNDALVGGLGSLTRAEAWVNNVKLTSPVDVKHGEFRVRVPPKGIVALKLGSVEAKTRLQHKVLDHSMPPLSPNSRVVGEAEGPFGITVGVVLRWGRGMTELYAYSQANSTIFGPLVSQDATATSHTVFDTVTLHMRVDGAPERVIVGTMFPFDFSVPLSDECKTVSFGFSGVSSQGATLRTRQFELHVTQPNVKPLPTTVIT